MVYGGLETRITMYWVETFYLTGPVSTIGDVRVAIILCFSRDFQPGLRYVQCHVQLPGLFYCDQKQNLITQDLFLHFSFRYLHS